MRVASSGAAVLVVEDETLVRMMAVAILMDAGYRVIEACNGSAAMLILESHDDIRAVFTDIEMPGMSGLDLAATIRGQWPAIAVLVTSGRIRPAVGVLPEGAGFISKPYTATAMTGQMAKLLGADQAGEHAN